MRPTFARLHDLFFRLVLKLRVEHKTHRIAHASIRALAPRRKLQARRLESICIA